MIDGLSTVPGVAFVAAGFAKLGLAAEAATIAATITLAAVAAIALVGIAFGAYKGVNSEWFKANVHDFTAKAPVKQPETEETKPLVTDDKKPATDEQATAPAPVPGKPAAA